MKIGDKVEVSGKTWVALGIITQIRGLDAPWVKITTGEHRGEHWSCLDLGSVSPRSKSRPVKDKKS